MGKQDAIQVAILAREARIEHEISRQGRLNGDEIEWTGYSVWLRDEFRGAYFRFDKADEASAWIASRKGERAEHGR